MRSYFSLVLAFLFFVFSHKLNPQCSNLTAISGTNAVLETEDIYLEDFSNQNDKGAVGGVLDVSGCNWLIDVSAATLSDANDYFKVTGIQFEVGANTPHERETYATELRDVYRYYYVHAAGSNKSIGQATVYQDNNLFCQIQFPVTMRTAPGLRTVSGSSFYLAYSNGGNDGFNQFSSLWNAQITGTGMNAYSNDGVSGRTAGHSAMIITNHANAMLGFIAEL